MTHVPAGAGRYPALNICMTIAAYSSSSLVHFPLLRGVTLAAGVAVEAVVLVPVLLSVLLSKNSTGVRCYSYKMTKLENAEDADPVVLLLY